MKTSIQINRKNLLSMLNVSGLKDVRYYLNGVCLELHSNMALLIGCDGHCMGVLRIDYSNESLTEPVQFIIPRETIEMLKSSKNITVDLNIDDGLNNFDNMIHFKMIDGKFPDFRRVFPSKCNGEVSQFDPNIVMQLRKCIDGIYGKKEQMEIAHNGTSAALVTVVEHSQFFGVVMPLRTRKTGEICSGVPSWLVGKGV